MFFTKKRNQQITVHTQTFYGKEFQYCYDDINDIISVTYFMKRYELSYEAATDLENWAKGEKEKFERAQRLYREFGIVATDTGAERPDLLTWYNSLTDEYKKRHVKMFDLENVSREEVITEEMKHRICGDFAHFLPEYGSAYNPDEENVDPSVRRGSIVINENGSLYTSNNPENVKSSIATNFQNQLWEDPKHRPTVAKWYKQIGGKLNTLGVKKEQLREPYNISLEIDLSRYKY
jgi:hypothetical protein